MAEKAKYIDVKELSIILDTIRTPDSEFATDDYIDGFSDGISTAIKELEAFPTADVAPVRHGRWIETAHKGYKCSLCNCLSSLFDENLKSEFCPWCGARMDDNKVE